MPENILETRIKQRCDTEANWNTNNPILLENEVGYIPDGRFKVGDGTSTWSQLSYNKADPTTHTHTKSQITDFPTSLKNPYSLTLQGNGTTLTNGTYDGSAAKTVNITPSSIGAATSSHTHTKSQITDFPSSLKNPYALNINGDTYDGSGAMDIDLLPFVVGTQTATTGSWTGNAPTISALFDGLTIRYWLPYAGSGNATLNLTLANGSTTGAKNCYYSGTSRLTTHYAAGNVITLTYRSGVSIAGSSTTYTGWWADANYDSDNTKLNVYREATTSTYNNDYPLLVSRTLASSITSTEGSASNIYAMIGSNDTTPTVNVQTGEIKAVKFTGELNGNAATATSATSATTATTLATARTIRTNLASTSTASFDGSANVTPGVTGTLPVGNGGTGQTTLVAAANSLINGLGTGDTEPTDDTTVVVQGVGSYTSNFYRKPISLIWNYIKGKISSVLGLTSSTYGGNSATATTATKLGTASVGSGTKPIYLNAGTATASSSTVGSSTAPVYMNSGTITACGSSLGVSITGNSATSTKLATARTIRTNLGSTSTASFDGSANITPGITGTLPIANGGTGAQTAGSATNNLAAQSLAPEITIASNEDLNDYVTPGCYKVDSSTVAATLSNTPITARGFMLSVYKTYGADSTNAYRTQIAMDYTGAVYTRYRDSSSNWGAWTNLKFTDTNTKVTQTTTTSNASYPLLLAPSGQTSTTTTTSYFDSGVTLNPSTNTIAANVSGSSASCTGNSATATALTTSAGSATQPVYFSSGKPVATTYTLGKSVPSSAVFTDTHYTTGLKVGASSTATANATATNGNVYLNALDNTTVRDSHKIVGSGATTVTSDANGVITISSTDNNTTYSAGTGLTLSGTQFKHSNSVTAGTAQGDASKTLTWSGTFTVPTVSYDATGHVTGKGTTTMTMPANPNTDKAVYQSATTTENYRPIVFGATNTTDTSALAASTTSQVYVNTTLYAQPSTGMLASTSHKIGEHVTLQYNSSTESLDFVFS